MSDGYSAQLSQTDGRAGVITPTRTAGTFDASNNLRPSDVAALVEMGIPPDTLAGPVPVRAGHVVFDALGFEFDHHTKNGEEGVRAYLFLITDHQGVARDVVAWAPTLNKIETWLGRAWALGEEQTFSPRLSEHQALPVWRTPLNWLRARRKGLCLVRPKAAVHYLCDAAPLLAEDAAHGAELKQLLTRPAPRIIVPASSTRKAA
ncbi:hypothetical protein [Microvirga aerophila]|uniref:Uncharacterized protein n=1 Tax=Microvirga aerophila TaxID=670291 RepID=A0A512C335_9HYPH|nr:hypothetical protein [Microvirga aerophila]GEO18619.1 hypothetical protein MAE02_63150 [Microvirga aerophila]